MLKETTQDQDKWIWKRPGAYRILELMKQGRSVPEIAEIVKWRQETIWNFVSSPGFLQKLEEHLKCIFFNFQKNKVLALEEISQLLWQVALGRKEIKGLTQDQAMGHLVKIFQLKEKEPKVINPKQYNIIMNIFKAEPKRALDLAKEFGFDKLLPREQGMEE